MITSIIILGWLYVISCLRLYQVYASLILV